MLICSFPLYFNRAFLLANEWDPTSAVVLNLYFFVISTNYGFANRNT